MISIHMIGGLHHTLNLPQKHITLDVDDAISFTDVLRLCGLETISEHMAEIVHVGYRGKYYTYKQAARSLKVEPGYPVTMIQMMGGG